jgi:hypothetical protein
MQIPGAYQEDESLGRPNVQDDDVLPGYEETQFIGPQQLQSSHMDLDGDEAIDVAYPMHGHQTPSWDDAGPCGSDRSGSGRAAPSLMMAVPPRSLDYNRDAKGDLSGNSDGSSTKAEVGDSSPTSNISDVDDERMKSHDEHDEPVVSPLINRNERESAPPPHMIEGEGDEDEDELQVVELRVDDPAV